MADYPTDFPQDAHISEIPKGGTLIIAPGAVRVYMMFWYQLLHVQNAEDLVESGLSENNTGIWTNTFFLGDQLFEAIPQGFSINSTETLLTLHKAALENPSDSFSKMIFFGNQSAVAHAVYNTASPASRPHLKDIITRADQAYRSARQEAFSSQTVSS